MWEYRGRHDGKEMMPGEMLRGPNKWGGEIWD